MTKPTPSALAAIIREYSPEKAAGLIHEMFNPVLKPLSELANSEEDCRKVFQNVFPDYQYRRTVKYSTGIEIIGDYSACMVTENTLRNADFIRSLGYDVTPGIK